MLKTLRKSKSLKLLRMTCVVSAYLAPTFSVAETVCEILPESIEVWDNAKEMFALGRYNEFFDFVNRVANVDTTAEASGNTPEEILSDAFPDGFQTCTTIMSHRVSKTFISEIVVFLNNQKRGAFMGWDAIKVSGSWIVVNYQIESNFDKIIAAWR